MPPPAPSIRLAPATEADYDAEFLDLVIAVRVVDDLPAALAHIARHGSDHTEAIATGDPPPPRPSSAASRSSAVMVNASSRFNDGGQLGLGAEIGISTTRLHAYGPMGSRRSPSNASWCAATARCGIRA